MKRTLVAIAVGMTVFAITPAVAQAAPGASVILIDKKDFAGDSVAEGLAGRGCQNVSQDNMATSVQPYGGRVTLYADRNCKGQKLVLKGDVADLGKFNMDNKTSSVSFG